MAQLRRFFLTIMALVLLLLGLAGWVSYWHFTNPTQIRAMILSRIQRELPLARLEMGAAHADLARGIQCFDLKLKTPEVMPTVTTATAIQTPTSEPFATEELRTVPPGQQPLLESPEKLLPATALTEPERPGISATLSSETNTPPINDSPTDAVALSASTAAKSEVAQRVTGTEMPANSALAQNTTPNEADLSKSDQPLHETDEILNVSEAQLQLQRDELLQGKMKIRKIFLNRPTLYLQEQADGSWNFQSILTGKKVNFPEPMIVDIKDGSIQIRFADQRRPSLEIHKANIQLRLQPPAEIDFEANFQVGPNATFRLIGRANLSVDRIHLRLETVQPVSFAEIRPQLPPQVLAHLAAFTQLEGNLNFRLEGVAQRRPANSKYLALNQEILPPVKQADPLSKPVAASLSNYTHGWDWNGNIQGVLSAGRINHPKLPYPISDLQLAFAASPSGLRLTDVHMKALTLLAELAEIKIPHWNWQQTEISGRVTQLPLTEPIRLLLPSRLQNLWDELQPEGTVELSGKLVPHESQWRIIGSMQLRNNALTYYKFPYRVQGVNGRVDFRANGQIELDGQGIVGAQPISLTGTISDPSPTASIELNLRGQQLPIDAALIKALPSEAANAVRLFSGDGQLLGTVDVQAKITRLTGEMRFLSEYHLKLQSPLCRYKDFPYPLHDVRGTVVVYPDQILIQNFIGHRQDAVVSVNGKINKYTTGGQSIELTIEGKRIPLDNELQTTLFVNPKWHSSWVQLQPDGVFDFTCELIKFPGDPMQTTLKFDLSKAAITPRAFPYRLESFTGSTFVCNNHRLCWEPLQFRHRDLFFTSSGGAVEFFENGGRLTIYDLHTSHLPLMDDFRQAVPASLQKMLDIVHLEQPIALRLHKFGLEYTTLPGILPTIYYDGVIAFKHARLLPAIGFQDVTGTVTVTGKQDAAGINTLDGQLVFEHLQYHYFKVENATSGLHVRGNQLWLDNLNSTLAFGQLRGSGNAWLITDLQENGRTQCRLSLERANLAEFVRQNWPSQRNVGGLVNGGLYLERSPALAPDAVGPTLTGRGHLTLEKANIYRLPLLLKFIEVFDLKTVPDGHLFETAKTSFHLKDQLLLVDELDLKSPTLNFVQIDGQDPGQIHLQTGEMNLTLGYGIGRNDFEIPLISRAAHMFNDQLITLHLTGTITNPELKRETGKGIRQVGRRMKNAIFGSGSEVPNLKP